MRYPATKAPQIQARNTVPTVLVKLRGRLVEMPFLFILGSIQTQGMPSAGTYMDGM